MIARLSKTYQTLVKGGIKEERALKLIVSTYKLNKSQVKVLKQLTEYKGV